MFRPFKNSYRLNFPAQRPRSLEQLQAERAYLLGILQRENEKATEFLRRIPPLEETILLSHNSHVRRAVKKQLGWLKYRIRETISQEKSIIARLGELSFDILSRERWNQIENKRRQRFLALDNHQRLFAQSMASTQFNPSSPEFYPPGYGPWIAGPQQAQRQYRFEEPVWQPSNYLSELPAQTCNQELNPFDDEKLNNVALPMEPEARYAIAYRPSSMNSAEFDVLTTKTQRLSLPQRRHSSPAASRADTT